MLNDESWYIKPHPISSKNFLRELGINYGYHRIIEPKESGINYIRQCEEVGLMHNSEMNFIAAYLKLPIIDVTNYTECFKLAYWGCTRNFTNDVEHNRNVVKRLFFNQSTGFIFSWHKDKKERAQAYFELAMAEREKFRMITHQKLSVNSVFFPPRERVVKKQEE